MNTPWWVEFLRWHVATDHEWDVALHMDAMAMGIDGISREIAEALLPAMNRVAESMRSLAQALANR